jgi:hypothetical protein
MSLIHGKTYTTKVHLATDSFWVDFIPHVERDEDDPSMIDIRIEVTEVTNALNDKEVAFSTFNPQDQREIKDQCMMALPTR